MQQLIEKMVTDFERGELSRRQLASALAGLAAAGANAAPNSSDFKAVSVNHITLRVPDAQRSTKFYLVNSGAGAAALALRSRTVVRRNLANFQGPKIGRLAVKAISDIG
jgi:hypothetical protein